MQVIEEQKISNASFLMVDDDVVVLKYNSYLLNIVFDAPRILTFFDSIDALNYLLPTLKDGLPIPDYLIIDLEMPDFDGFSFLAQLMQYEDELKDKKLIILTVKSLDEVAPRLKDFKNIQYIKKPLSREKLIDLVKP